MKIRSLQISNVLSFGYVENFEDAAKIAFEGGVNILIGQNGAGKSTALEVINFIFKRVIFPQYLRNQDYYDKRTTIAPNQIKSVIYRTNGQSSFAGFRLDPNWDTPDKEQRIRVAIALDTIDVRNIDVIRTHFSGFSEIAKTYCGEAFPQNVPEVTNTEITFDIRLHRSNNTFSFDSTPGAGDVGVIYLTQYNFFRELIDIHNIEMPSSPIPALVESFALIGGYRNYHAFTEGISIAGQSAEQQIQGIKAAEDNKSTNANEQNEPHVFNLVRLLIAAQHFKMFGQAHLEQEAEKKANEQGFLRNINAKLALVGLSAGVKLLDKRQWQYSFTFTDVKRNKKLPDINSLSAGQKAIIHLVFEAYGRGELKGGVVIIDEPEIHLHYQLQGEYLRIIEEINKEQDCQYILVTHSELRRFRFFGQSDKLKPAGRKEREAWA